MKSIYCFFLFSLIPLPDLHFSLKKISISLLSLWRMEKHGNGGKDDLTE
jgi:hypothetical protein